jgi:Malectin-like domain
VYPRFQISLGATYWDEITITNAAIPVIREMVILAPSRSISVCLFNASSGVPFISTIELRQFDGNMYYSKYEAKYFMFVSRRVNMGARSNASIR